MILQTTLVEGCLHSVAYRLRIARTHGVKEARLIAEL